jgi:osmotically-inducible protein OsmY
MSTADDLRQDVIAELAWDMSLDDQGIGVAATTDTVTLTGYVRSYAEKRAAEKAAKRVRGVTVVANDLEVRLPDIMRRDDPDIAAAVAATLKWNVSVPNDVNATVEHGWVTLEGDVDWTFQRRAAERAVRDLVGVRGVTNLVRLRVRPVPQNVTDQIHRAFHRSAQIDADHVKVAVHDGVVTLSGNVRSWSEKMEAEHAARAGAGVKEVDNQLRVSSMAGLLV